MDLDTIKKSIKNWNDVRNTELGLTYLTSGFGFEINRNEYQIWKEIIDKKIFSDTPLNNNTAKYNGYFIHLYIGISSYSKTIFHLVDSITESDPDHKYSASLVTKKFTKESIEKQDFTKDLQDVEIQDIKAVKRAFKWFFQSNSWAYNKLNPSDPDENPDVVRVFTIHFQDFYNIFEDENNKKAFLFFGLTNMTREGRTSTMEIEVILCPEKGFLDNGNKSQDVTTPRPPYSITNKNLNLL